MEEWKTEYYNLLKKETLSNEDLRNAISIKNSHLPKKLFKYFPSIEIANEAINSELLPLNSPSSYNDPFECYEFIDDELVKKITLKLEIAPFLNALMKAGVISKEEAEFHLQSDDPFKFVLDTLKANTDTTALELQLLKLKDSMQKSFIKKIALFQTRIKMTCFSEKNNNLLMWGLYAKNHEGVCIEFSIDNWKENETIKQLLFPVIYTDEIYNATTHFLRSYQEKPSNNHYTKISWISKCIDWSHEKEWRIIMVDDVFKNNFKLPISNISAVYLGAKSNDYKKEETIQICNRKGIDIFQGFLSRSMYRIEFKKLNDA